MYLNDYFLLQAVVHFVRNKDTVSSAVNKVTVRVRPLVLVAKASFIIYLLALCIKKLCSLALSHRCLVSPRLPDDNSVAFPGTCQKVISHSNVVA